jgi:hypothetical protein
MHTTAVYATVDITIIIIRWGILINVCYNVAMAIILIIIVIIVIAMGGFVNYVRMDVSNV